MLTSQHINEAYFLAINSLNLLLTPCLCLYNIYTCLLYHSSWSSRSKSKTRSFLFECHSKKTSILTCLMVFKLQRRLIHISCCHLACKNISHTFHLALASLYLIILKYRFITHTLLHFEFEILYS